MHISKFDINDLPNSSFNIFLGKRRSGKSCLCEYMLSEMVKNKMVDVAVLISQTDAGFEIITDRECRTTDIKMIDTIIKNYALMNDYNKNVKKKKDKIKLRTVVVIDDCAVKLKSKEFNILETLAVNGRHLSYEPLSLHFMILCQSLTKIPRVVRLNCDMIFLNMISSQTELNMILDENFYLLDSSIAGKRAGRELYHNLVTSEPFQFIAIQNYKQNCTCYNDYLKTYKAIL